MKKEQSDDSPAKSLPFLVERDPHTGNLKLTEYGKQWLKKFYSEGKRA